MLEDLGDGVAVEGHEALVGVAQLGHVEAEQQLAVAEQLGDARLAGGFGRGLGVAAQVEGFGDVHHQQADRAMALQLHGKAAGLLEVAADHRGDGARRAEQVAHRGRVVTVFEEGAPDVVELDDGAADVEVVEEETLDVAAEIAHSVAPAGVARLA